MEAHYLHVRKNIETGEVGLLFLDINPDIKNKIYRDSLNGIPQGSIGLNDHNLNVANRFVDELRHPS